MRRTFNCSQFKSVRLTLMNPRLTQSTIHTKHVTVQRLTGFKQAVAGCCYHPRVELWNLIPVVGSSMSPAVFPILSNIISIGNRFQSSSHQAPLLSVPAAAVNFPFCKATCHHLLSLSTGTPHGSGPDCMSAGCRVAVALNLGGADWWAEWKSQILSDFGMLNGDIYLGEMFLNVFDIRLFVICWFGMSNGRTTKFKLCSPSLRMGDVGWGACASEDISVGHFVCQYTGRWYEILHPM